MPIRLTLFSLWGKSGLATGMILAIGLTACATVPAPATGAPGQPGREPVAPSSTPDSNGNADVNANPVDSEIQPSPTAPGGTDSTNLTPATTPDSVFTLPPLVPTSEPPVIGEIPADLMAKLTDDVQKRAGVAPESIVTLRAEAVTWNDGSLGCPQPGMFYTQALVDGYWVILQVGDVVYDYRTSGTAYFVLCEQPSFPQKPFSTAPPIVVQP
jgi:hypothetical protein